KNTILGDFYRFFLGGREHSINNKYILTDGEVGKKGEVKKKSINLKKVFITFKLEKSDAGDITLTGDTGLHDFYIGYVRNKNIRSGQLSYCDITGKPDYCITRHRGLIGNAKLIGISNNN